MRKRLTHGSVVHVTLPLPTKLRSHGFSEAGYNMYAIVRRVEPLADGFRITGLEFIGATPPADYLTNRGRRFGHRSGSALTGVESRARTALSQWLSSISTNQ